MPKCRLVICTSDNGKPASQPERSLEAIRGQDHGAETILDSQGVSGTTQIRAAQRYEMLSVVSSEVLRTPGPNKAFLDYRGSITGSTIGPVELRMPGPFRGRQRKS
jgi:hypothetical protein